ncbi:MAG: hypothetical protein KDJ96_01380 [Rhodobacteraceae bacterium]|nr:hypothetical protein [Paracoccaceae bacterium]
MFRSIMWRAWRRQRGTPSSRWTMRAKTRSSSFPAPISRRIRPGSLPRWQAADPVTACFSRTKPRTRSRPRPRPVRAAWPCSIPPRPLLDPLLAILPHVTHLLVNAGEARALIQATGQALTDLPVQAVIVTRGAEGAEWIAPGSATVVVPAFPVTPVDTTGAGDCFAGSLAAALDRGNAPEQALRYAAAAAALQVTRPGAAGAMPLRAEVEALLSGA